MGRYITFARYEDALTCIFSVDGCLLQGSTIRASFGTTKYCNYYLRGIRCTNVDCMYLHEMADPGDCFTRKEMQTKQSEFYAKTHPGRSEVHHAGNMDCLPPPTFSISQCDKENDDENDDLVDNISSSIQSIQSIQSSSSSSCNTIPTDFDDQSTFSHLSDLSTLNDLQPSLLKEIFPSKPFRCMNVPFGEVHFTIASIPDLLSTSSIPCISPTSAEKVDVDFLFKAEEYVSRRRRKPCERRGERRSVNSAISKL